MIALARIIQPTGQTGLPKRLQCGNNGGMAARKTKGTNGGAAASTAPDKGSRARETPHGNAQVGDTAAVWTSLDDLHGWPRNPRKNQDTVWRVVALIIKFGFGRPVGARRANGELVWGHTATAAAHQLAREWATAAPEERGRWHKDAVPLFGRSRWATASQEARYIGCLTRLMEGPSLRRSSALCAPTTRLPSFGAGTCFLLG